MVAVVDFVVVGAVVLRTRSGLGCSLGTGVTTQYPEIREVLLKELA